MRWSDAEEGKRRNGSSAQRVPVAVVSGAGDVDQRGGLSGQSVAVSEQLPEPRAPVNERSEQAATGILKTARWRSGEVSSVPWPKRPNQWLDLLITRSPHID